MEELRLSVINQSVDSSGITNDYKEAISEYIWNGFEAQATEVKITYTQNVAAGIDVLSIEDNGDGIVYEDLSDTFGSFLTSKKNTKSIKEKSKSNKGKGRFSFAAFAEDARWDTVYKKRDEFYKYAITSQNSKKEVIQYSEPVKSKKKKTGTVVTFTNINTLTTENMDFAVLEPYLLKEFAWYLYLGKGRKLRLVVNGVPVSYEKNINTQYSETIIKTIDGKKFKISLIVWNDSIREKFCCYYFDNNHSLKGKETTSFNRNTINFSHSVFVESVFFDNKEDIDEDLDSEQGNLFIAEEDKKTFRALKRTIAAFIERKMSAFMTEKADEAVREMMEERNTFPSFPNDFYGTLRKEDLAKVTRELYKMEPRLFYKLRPIQEKSLLAFLNLVLCSEERESVLDIVEQIVELTPAQRNTFSNMLKKTRLENIIDTIRFVQDRYQVIELLKSLIYDLTKFTNERDHIQKIVEQHFWLFGEQYNLASADMRMQKALEGYTNILYGENNIDAILNPDDEQERRMDIFMCSNRKVETTYETTLEENIIVELKAPKVPLSKKVLRQIEDYMDFVRRHPEFNSELRRWKFIAVCKELDDDVKARLKAFKDKGKIGLVSQVDEYEVYAYTWDDIFKSFEITHGSLLDKLKYDREQLARELLESVSSNEGREKANALTDVAVNHIANVS